MSSPGQCKTVLERQQLKGAKEKCHKDRTPSNSCVVWSSGTDDHVRNNYDKQTLVNSNILHDQSAHGVTVVIKK